MTENLLDNARDYLVLYSRDKLNQIEAIHPWRKDWEFSVLHSLRVERYVLKILDREHIRIPDADVHLIQLAAILHDIARLDNQDNHALAGATIARDWLEVHADGYLTNKEIDRVVDLIANHSNKSGNETNFCRAVLKDADTLDEIGVMSIFMASNWLDAHSPFFFNSLLCRLVEHEIPFCDMKLAILNTGGAKEILREKREFILHFIEQLTDELQLDSRINQQLMSSSS